MLNLRAERRLSAPDIIFHDAGFEVCRYEGGEGDFMEAEYPPGEHRIDEMPFLVLIASGGTLIEEVEAKRVYLVDKDHARGTLVDGDGSPYMTRSAGLHRIHFKDNTVRLCIYPVNEFGLRSFEAMGNKHMAGPQTFRLPKGALFVLSVGSATVRRVALSAPHVVVARDADLLVVMEPGSHGGMVWKL